ncbi:MAG: hypothetical protein WD904_10570 [Dehalococcoidia bacterium]
MAREFVTRRAFDRSFKRLPKHIQADAIEKFARFLDDPSHPSLRVKRVKGTEDIWEMSVTMNYSVTFEVEEERLILRRIGTHDILRHP